MVGVGGSSPLGRTSFLNLVFSFFPLFLLCIQYIKDLHCLRMRYQKENRYGNFVQLHFAFNGPFGDAMAEQLEPLLSRLIRNLVFCGRYGQKVKEP